MTILGEETAGTDSQPQSVDRWDRQKAEADWNRHESAFADQILSNVQHYRKQQALTAKVLSERITSHGWPLSVSSINGMLGKKGRKTITVTEWFVLAKALHVPPLVLLIPVHTNGAVAVLPGSTPQSVLAVAEWITGGSDIPHQSSDLTKYEANDTYDEAMKRLDHLTEHQNVLAEIRQHNALAIVADERQDLSGHQRAVYRMNLVQAIESLRYTIALGQKNGLPPLPIPPQLEPLARDRGQVPLPLVDFNTDEETEHARGSFDMDFAYLEFQREVGPELQDRNGQRFIDWFNKRGVRDSRTRQP